MKIPKFRIWNGKYMDYRPTLSVGGPTIDVNNEFEKIRNIDEIWMECIGLSDRRGKDIYDGDILTSDIYPFQSEGEYNYFGVVEWVDESASFYITKRRATKTIRGTSDGMSEPIEGIHRFEVVGNIYENAVLLM